MNCQEEQAKSLNKMSTDSDAQMDSPMCHLNWSYKNRMSLAYWELDNMPKQILQYISNTIEILDLSYNCVKDLSFLSLMPRLQTLVLDRNCNLNYSTIPKLENLEILWLNNCNIINITDWLHTLKDQCSSLKQLSMMCNPVGQTTLNGVTDAEESEYRRHVLQILPTLEYFDGTVVTESQRQIAKSTPTLLSSFEKISRKKFKNVLDTSMAKINKSLGYVSSMEMSFCHSNLKNKLIDGTCTSLKYTNL